MYNTGEITLKHSVPPSVHCSDRCLAQTRNVRARQMVPECLLIFLVCTVVFINTAKYIYK